MADITKIYDKNKGTTYNIGGSNKMKLVAEGTMNYDSDSEIYYTNISPLKQNKLYLFKIDSEYDDHSFIVLTNSLSLAISPVLFSNAAGTIYFAFSDGMAEVFDNDNNTIDLYDGSLFKIYELPFELED